MSGCKHPLTNFTLLLILFLLYSVYPIPFITTSDFQHSEDFLLIDTSGASATLVTAFIGNILTLVTLLQLKNTAKYLYVLMVVSDLLHPFCYLPGKLEQNWQNYKYFMQYNKEKLTSNTKERFMNHYFSIRHGLAVFSIICFSLICILDFYTAANKVKKDKLSMTVKGATAFISIKISIFLGWLYYVNLKNGWSKAVTLSVLSYFIPIVVCTLCLVLSHFIRNFVDSSIIERLTVHQPSYKFMWTLWLSYLLFYTPWFIWIYKDPEEDTGKAHAMNMLMLMKSCSNIFLLIEFDVVLKSKLKTMICDSYGRCKSTIKKDCCCCYSSIRSCVTTSKWKIRQKVSLTKSNTFIVVETANGITLQNGNDLQNGNLPNGSSTTRSVVSMV